MYGHYLSLYAAIIWSLNETIYPRLKHAFYKKQFILYTDASCMRVCKIPLLARALGLKACQARARPLGILYISCMLGKCDTLFTQCSILL